MRCLTTMMRGRCPRSASRGAGVRHVGVAGDFGDHVAGNKTHSTVALALVEAVLVLHAVDLNRTVSQPGFGLNTMVGLNSSRLQINTLAGSLK